MLICHTISVFVCHREYTDTICWVSNTYYLPFDEVAPVEPHYSVAGGKEPKHQMISYYQWIPLILMFQASMAFVPCLVWRFLNKRSG